MEGWASFFDRGGAKTQSGKNGKETKSENAEGAEVTLVAPDFGQGLEVVCFQRGDAKAQRILRK